MVALQRNIQGECYEFWEPRDLLESERRDLVAKRRE